MESIYTAYAVVPPRKPSNVYKDMLYCNTIKNLSILRMYYQDWCIYICCDTFTLYAIRAV